ncbi:MAG: GntR family transcriptional regulator [Anaerolineales bacterium]|jgi:GntR family transcriptional regulator
MNLEIDFRSGIPIYLQVVERIKERLAAGQLKPGDQLPTVRSLAADLRVNFNTIARAYRIMDESGIISTQQGRGTYILEMPTPEVAGSIRQKALEDLTQRYIADAERLGISPEELDKVLNEKILQWKENWRSEAIDKSDEGANKV